MGEAAIRVGIIGLSARGGWAATAHLPALRAMRDRFEITSLAASSPETAEAAASAHGIAHWTDDPAELAERPDVDLVVVTVKVPRHRELVGHAIAAGKAIYCEWPLGNGLSEAEAMATAAEGKSVPAFAGLQARSAPAIRFLRDLVREGFVGEVISSTVVGSGGFPWGGSASAGTAYVNDVTTGATMLTIPFGHMLDAFTWILGEFEHVGATLATRRPRVRLLDDARTITATAPDQVAVTGILEGGAVASLHYRGGLSAGTNFLWEIDGSDGTLVIDGADGHLQYGHLKIRGSKSGEPLATLDVPDRYRRIGTDPLGYADAVAHAYLAVHDEMRGGDRRAPHFQDAVGTHRLLDRIVRAAQSREDRT